jgi:hypothetical protein
MAGGYDSSRPIVKSVVAIDSGGDGLGEFCKPPFGTNRFRVFSRKMYDEVLLRGESVWGDCSLPRRLEWELVHFCWDQCGEATH